MVMKKKLKAKQAPAKKKVAVSASPAKKSAKKVVQIDKPYTKPQIIAYLSDSMSLTRVQAENFLDSLATLVELHLQKKGPGVIVLPGVAKFQIKRKPAVKARQGVNPFTGKQMTYPAKAAFNAVKIKALKKLRDIVA